VAVEYTVTSIVLAIDTATRKVVNHWPIAPGEEASGMAIDLEHHRLYWVLMGIVWDQCDTERWPTVDDFSDSVKVMAGLRRSIFLPDGNVIYSPGSIDQLPENLLQRTWICLILHDLLHLQRQNEERAPLT